MLSPRLFLALTAASLAVPAALCAPALAAPRHHFDMTFALEQVYTWSQDTRSTACGAPVVSHGGGRETLELRTSRPVRVTAERRAGWPVAALTFGGRGPEAHRFDVVGAYTRDGSVAVRGGPGCGGGAPAGPSDCGERPVRGRLTAYHVTPDRWPDDPAPLGPAILLDGPKEPGDAAPWEAFRRCAGGGGADLLHPPPGALATRTLTGRTRRFVVRGRGRKVLPPGSGHRATVETTWVMSFTRVR